ncbi:MAG: SDR family NAD(P)-dependent oxidoreductase [Candidatus Aminicenantes bacterium]|nr:MAG: SDR family NAD(P)-dependent oxidoreductase [Candidatus Aminicenantes bacterium]
MTENLAEYFKENLLNRGNHKNPTNPGPTLADAAYTLQVGRKAFPHRKIWVYPTNGIRAAIHALEHGELETGLAGDEKPTVVFMFSGQGSQFVNMGLDLYNREPVFRDQVDHCFEILENIIHINMKPVLYPHKENTEEAAEKIGQFLYTTPIKFIFEYSLAVLLMTWGIQPDAMIGHSFGEYAAACLSGVFSLEDALFMAARRGRLMHGLPPGAMLSVPLSEEKLKPLLNSKISLAAVNGESLCVVSGPVQDIDAFENQLNEKGHECLRYYVPKAGHSAMVEPILEEFKEKISRVTFNKPKIPYISGLTGKWITTRQAMDPGYWTRHLRNTVRFADGLTTLFQQPNPIFLQVGPGRGLTLFVNQHPGKKISTPALDMVRHRKEEVSDVYYTLTKVGQLWLKGVSIDWQAFYAGQERCRIPLPTYFFERSFYPLQRDLFRVPGDASITPPGKTKPRKKPSIADWFYIPLWERRPLPPGIVEKEKNNTQAQTWLVFMDKNRAQDIGPQLAARLKHNNHKVITVRKGTTYEKKSQWLFFINPAKAEDYNTLLQHLHLELKERFPQRIIHLWGVDEEKSDIDMKDKDKDGGYNVNQLTEHLSMGFYSLIYLAKALGNLEAANDIQIDVITSGVHEITGDERLSPGKAAVLGPVKVIPQEYPHTRCRSIDIARPQTRGQDKALLEQLLLEIFTRPTDTIVAFRTYYRWVLSTAPMPLPDPDPKKLPLKQAGSYLVTGGLGGIGLILAEHLAKSLQARLILTGRSPLPPAPQWDQWLRSHDPDNSTSRKIEKLKQMEKMGAKVLALPADVSNQEQMEEVLLLAEEKFGPLNGVIHCAASTGDHMVRSIKDLGDTDCQDQFRAKIYGVLVLEELLRKKQELDFCLLMSSTSAILGGLGFAAYSAANIFLDAYAHFYKRARTSPGRWISVNWDAWQTGEVRDKNTSLGTVGASIAELAMTPAQGAEAVERILSWPGAQQVIQCAGDIQSRIQQWINLESLPDQDLSTKQKTRARQSRPALPTSYTPPANPGEQTLVNIWQELLGYEHIGTRDNFFQLGGDSLKAVIVTSKIHKTLNIKIPLKDFFNQPTIEALARYISRGRKSIHYSIPPIEKKEYYPLSSAQKRMFILNQVEKENRSTAYTIPSLMVLEGELDRDRFEEIFRTLISRHESFRTAFQLMEGEPIQRIHDEVNFEIEYFLATEDTEDTEGKNYKLQITNYKQIPNSKFQIIHHFFRPFDLSRAPLLRVGLVKYPHTPPLAGHPSQDRREQEHLLMVNMHHIISDGTSMGILIKEFTALYQGKSLPLLKIQYKDFSRWQDNEKKKKVFRQQEAYWLKQFEKECPVLDLPLDYKRQAAQGFEGSQLDVEVGKEPLRQLKAVAAEQGATLFIVLLSIYIILLSKISSQEDIIVGTGVAGRRHPDLNHVMGMFVNMLPLRNYPQAEKTFKEFLADVKKRTLEAFENQDYPFEDLVSKIPGKRDANRNAIFDTAFELQNVEIPTLDIPGLKIKPYEHKENLSRFDMAWVGEEIDGKLIFQVEYSTKLFKKETLECFRGYFLEILSTVIENTEIKLKDIHISHGLLSPKPEVPKIDLRF